MIDTSEVMGFALGDFSTTCAIADQTETIDLIPDIDPGSVDGDMVDRPGPSALASMADVQACDLVAGRYGAGTVLTINDADYLVRSIDPDGHGGAILGLEPV